MRLTLRTLLAYIDGILEGQDAQDIREQLEKSEYAQNLVTRIRDAIGQLRLSAPQLFEDEGGLDPNTVAEYLDNTLSGDRVAEFEKKCLESDMHLAEVASCHQILTLVLGEAAEIDQTARERMYGLPDAPTPSPVAEPPGAAPAVPAPPVATGDGDAVTEDAATRAPREKPQVPEYLREPAKPRRLLPIAGAVALAVCFLVMVLIALGQFEPGTPPGELIGLGDKKEPVAAGEPPVPPEDIVPGGVPPIGAPIEPTVGRSGTPSQPGQQAEPAQEPLPDPGEPAEPATLPEEGAAPIAPVEPPPVEPPPGGEAPPAPMPAGEGPEQLEPGEVEPGGAAPGEIPGLPGEPLRGESAEEPAEEVVTQPEKPEEPAEEPETEPAIPMGRFLSDEQILLRYESEDDAWVRVAAKGSLYPSDRLVALPTFRPEIGLAAGTTLQLLGGTQVELLRAGAEKVAGVQVDFGRLLVQALAQPGTQMRLVAGEQRGVVTFVDPEAVVAVAVEPVRIPGTNPEKVEPITRSLIYVRSGEVTWAEAGMDAPLPLQPQTCLMLAGRQPRVPIEVDKFPIWVTSDTLSELDRRASSTLLKEWQPDVTAERALIELATSRRREVQWLVAGAMGYIGLFEPTVAPLSQPSYWESFRRYADSADYIGELHWALARGPQTAAAVRLAFERHFPDNANRLYRMLWGYTPDGLRSGDAAVLVDNLEDDSLPVRGLAFWNLRQLTGWSHGYEPEATAANREKAVARWREKLAAGEISEQAAARFPSQTPVAPPEPAEPAEPAELPAEAEPAEPVMPIEPAEPPVEPPAEPPEDSEEEPAPPPEEDTPVPDEPEVFGPPSLGPAAPPIELD